MLHAYLYGYGTNGGGGGPVLGASFDSTSTYLLRGGDYTLNVDSKVGTFAARLRFNAAGNTFYAIQANQGLTFSITRNLGTIRVVGKNAALATILDLRTTSLYTDADGYININADWDLSEAVLSDRGNIYVNDVSETNLVTGTDDTIDYTVADHAIGAQTNGGGKIDGDINFTYFNNVERIDSRVEANRRKFFDASGNVVDLGADGSTPTGSAPLIFLDGSYDQWEDNKGTGDGLTVIGALERPTS